MGYLSYARYSAYNGNVYGVFCWEKEQQITYNDVKGLTDKDAIKAANIGYYGGMENSQTMNASDNFEQSLIKICNISDGGSACTVSVEIIYFEYK